MHYTFILLYYTSTTRYHATSRYAPSAARPRWQPLEKLLLAWWIAYVHTTFHFIDTRAVLRRSKIFN